MLVEDYEHEGVKVEIHQDDDAESPRDWDNMSVMFCWHPRYELGDEQFGREGAGRDLTFHTMEEVVSYLQSDRLAKVILPLFLYDHGGITIRAGDPILGDPTKETNQERIKSRGRFTGDGAGWDTTHVGFIYTNDELLDKVGTPPELAIKALRQDVEVYDQYLTCDVYYYTVGEDTPFSESLSGLYGLEYAKQQANEMAEFIAKKLERESDEAAHWAARDTVTVNG